MLKKCGLFICTRFISLSTHTHFSNYGSTSGINMFENQNKTKPPKNKNKQTNKQTKNNDNKAKKTKKKKTNKQTNKQKAKQNKNKNKQAS